MYLTRVLSAWTERRSLEMVYDTDVDDAWDGDRVLATLKAHRAHAFVWITADGDAYGISVPSLVSFMDVMVEPTADMCVFCTCTHLDRMVPIRYVPDRNRVWHVRATIGRDPHGVPVHDQTLPPIAYVNVRTSIAEPVATTYSSSLPLFASATHWPDLRRMQRLTHFWGLGMSNAESHELCAMAKAPIVRALVLQASL